MRDLLTHPLWRPEDLGQPIPDSPHAVSVAMPTWQSVIGYEEEDPVVHRALKCGYPRFFCHPQVQSLFEEATRRHAGPGETAVVFSSEAACRRCAAFLEAEAATALETRLIPWPGSRAAVLVFPEVWRRAALRYWRYTGELVSSRQATALLEGTPEIEDGGAGDEALRRRLASWSGRPEENGHLYASGMAAIFAAFRATLSDGRRGKTVQLEFPYVDAFCIQKFFGHGAHLLLGGDSITGELKRLLEAEPIQAVFCEIPCNPLIRTVDLPAVSRICREARVPLIVDDTVGTVYNVDVYPYADMVTTSLTKNISGVGDVMGGSVWVCQDSPFAERLQAFLSADRGAPLFSGDVEALLANSEDFFQRMKGINANGAALAAYLAERPEVQQLYYPSCVTAEHYEKIRRAQGGYSGLLSMVLHGGEAETRLFYDALEVNKGPSLGTDYTLVCPYTLLAHYGELDWAEACGVSRYLLRVSVGIEPLETLIARFDKAFEAIRAQR